MGDEALRETRDWIKTRNRVVFLSAPDQIYFANFPYPARTAGTVSTRKVQLSLGLSFSTHFLSHSVADQVYRGQSWVHNVTKPCVSPHRIFRPVFSIIVLFFFPCFIPTNTLDLSLSFVLTRVFGLRFVAPGTSIRAWLSDIGTGYQKNRGRKFQVNDGVSLLWLNRVWLIGLLLLECSPRLVIDLL